jgi:IS30 family transposase
LSDIARALGKQAGSIFGVLATNGGISPRSRSRHTVSLTPSDREAISRGLVEGASARGIAVQIKRPPSTVSREIARNGGRSGYRATQADERAWEKARRPKTCLLSKNNQLRELVAAKLEEDWSPQQIAGWLAARGMPREMRISHETIYKTLYVRARGALRRELIGRLRTRRKFRKARRSTTAGQTRGQIVGAVSIRSRPAIVETRAVPGHWEGDLLSGARNSHVATLVERFSRYTLLVRVEGKAASLVCSALSKTVTSLPSGLFRSITWDRGTELAQHSRFSRETGVPIYFCDAKSPWQRGTNENTNGLLRQYFPDGVDLSGYTQRDLDLVAASLNRRPRRTLGYLAPRDRIIGAVAPTD